MTLPFYEFDSPKTQRMKLVLATLREMGAATTADLSEATGIKPSTMREYARELKNSGRIVVLERAQGRWLNLFGPSDKDHEAQIQKPAKPDYCRVITKDWPRGQHMRDPMVAAIFGPAAEVRL
jgi:predicted ArsR family transcriptional regulator